MNVLSAIAKQIIIVMLVLVLTDTLLFQLWNRQLLPQTVDTLITELTNSIGLELPARRDFSLLFVTAAQQKQHPKYQELSLIQAKLVNRAAIVQPLPTIQLSLTNAAGRLIAQRALAPQEYLGTGNKPTLIAAKQIKPISIELAAFPDEISGFELKLLPN